jgi:chemotaxis protein methyltransferase CheR
MSEAGAAIPVILSAEDLQRITGLIYRWTGMTFGEAKRYYIERRIGERLRCTGIQDIRTYLATLAASEAERQALINAFTINETYFFREDHQFGALATAILPELIRGRRPGDLIRIWSLPCSTGEEAYSLAIWLLEYWPLVDSYNIEIVGSDIDTAALEQAMAGRYAQRSLARLPAELVERYFEPEHHHRRKIIDDLRESVRFTVANLIDGTSLAAQGRFDVILCRNLLIYFDDDARAVAATNLFESLAPGGYLCLGHSESMTRISDRFNLVRLPDAIVYRRP